MLSVNDDVFVCQVDKLPIVLASFIVNLKQIQVFWEEKISVEKMSPKDCPVGKSI